MPCGILAAEKPNDVITDANTLFHIEQQDRTFNGKEQRIFIAMPKQNDNGKVLYLLDGNAYFLPALQALDPLLPLPTIVALGYPTDKAYAVAERTRDYTFHAEGEAFVQGGGAEDFLVFVRQLPLWLAQHYAIEPQQTLFFGHSFGGLFGAYVLLNQPHLFDHYILASPSLWWGDGTILQQRRAEFQQIRPASLLFTLGEYEAKPHTDPNQDPARLQRILTRRNHLKVEDLQTQLTAQGIHSHFIMLEKTNHGSSALAALKLALHKAQAD